MIACLWWVSYGLGDTIITFIMGAAIQYYGARVMPIVIAVPMVIGFLLSLLSWRFYIKVKEKETAALNTITTKSVQKDTEVVQ